MSSELHVGEGQSAAEPLLRPDVDPSEAGSRVHQAVRFHDLRHLAGTTAAASGASVEELMSRTGHAGSDASLGYLAASQRRDAEVAAGWRPASVAT